MDPLNRRTRHALRTDMMLSWCAFAFLPLIVSILLWAAKPLLIPRKYVRNYTRAPEIRKLLNPPNISLGDLLLARAIPNQRLVHAFKLTNTFVSGDIKVHRIFTTRAKALIASSGDKDHAWRSVALSAEATAQRFLPVQHGVVELATLVQSITFSIVLSILFHTDLDMLSYDDVVYVTKIINQRWEDSKIKGATTMQRDDSLIAHINRWIVDPDQYGNPLNFILPAYETMWRVVAGTIAYAYRYRDNTLHSVMVEFWKGPTEQRFQTFGEDGLQPSMESIILEVLRLHPPTRHIARTSTQGSGSWWPFASGPVTEIADIEQVHLSDEYGENTSKFDPMRFHASRMRERPELFSFGYGKLKCIAAAWAPMAAATIAAAIVSQIEEEELTITIGPNVGGRSGWDGWTVYRGNK